jgi:hypothetical protein
MFWQSQIFNPFILFVIFSIMPTLGQDKGRTQNSSKFEILECNVLEFLLTQGRLCLFYLVFCVQSFYFWKGLFEYNDRRTDARHGLKKQRFEEKQNEKESFLVVLYLSPFLYHYHKFVLSSLWKSYFLLWGSWWWWLLLLVRHNHNRIVACTRTWNGRNPPVECS